MKKIFEVIKNPLIVLGTGGVLFVLGFINAIANHASSMEDLSWWGKAASIGFTIVLAALMLRYFVIPIGGWIWKWFINLFN